MTLHASNGQRSQALSRLVCVAAVLPTRPVVDDPSQSLLTGPSDPERRLVVNSQNAGEFR